MSGRKMPHHELLIDKLALHAEGREDSRIGAKVKEQEAVEAEVEKQRLARLAKLPGVPQSPKRDGVSARDANGNGKKNNNNKKKKRMPSFGTPAKGVQNVATTPAAKPGVRGIGLFELSRAPLLVRGLVRMGLGDATTSLVDQSGWAGPRTSHTRH